jgi:hypothetical protein
VQVGASAGGCQCRWVPFSRIDDSEQTIDDLREYHSILQAPHTLAGAHGVLVSIHCGSALIHPTSAAWLGRLGSWELGGAAFEAAMEEIKTGKARLFT